MTTTSTVVDASVVVAALLDSGPDGRWAESVIASGPVIGPHLLPVEVTAVVRRSLLSARVSPDAAAQAHHDLTGLAVTLFPCRPFSDRVWELRHDVASYDAWYVALAEAVDAPMATLDRRLAGAAEPRCRFLTPP